MNYWRELELVNIPTCTSDIIEISNACDQISKRLKKLGEDVLESQGELKYSDELLDMVYDLREDFIDCADNENFVMYYNEHIQKLYDLADTVVTYRNESVKFLSLVIN